MSFVKLSFATIMVCVCASADSPNRWNERGLAYYREGRLADAEKAFRSALAVGDLELSEIDAAAVNHNLGEVYLATGLLAKAEACLKRAVETRLRVYGANSVSYASSLATLASVYAAEKRLDDAEVALAKSVNVLEFDPSRCALQLSDALNSLASVRFSRGHYAEAVTSLERALELRETENGRSLLRILGNLVAGYSAVHRNADAIAAAERALEIADRNEAPPQVMAEILLNYADCLKRTPRRSEAPRLRKRAEAMLRTELQRNPAKQTIDYRVLSNHRD